MEQKEQLPDALSMGLHTLVHVGQIASTMDEAHRLAEGGAPAGTCVVADVQTAARGRSGNVWASDHRGLWMTLLERPQSAASLDVLSLRTGLAIADVLEQLDTDEQPFRLKWPNDVFKGERKIAGVLVEARWREQSLEWVALGIGINLATATTVSSAAASANVSRGQVLQLLIPLLRSAAAGSVLLSNDELARWARRDLARDRTVVSPAVGVANGIAANGALLVETSKGVHAECRSGSLVFRE